VQLEDFRGEPHAFGVAGAELPVDTYPVGHVAIIWNGPPARKTGTVPALMPGGRREESARKPSRRPARRRARFFPPPEECRCRTLPSASIVSSNAFPAIPPSAG